jgi:hypothetical protein
MSNVVVMGRDGKPVSRKDRCKLSAKDRIKRYRKRMGLKPRRGTFTIFAIQLPQTIS